ncbi:MAG: MATE family efflux transporter, partial [Pygmaiobacter sp.]
MRDKAFYRTIFAIALPVAFQNLISQLVNLVDNMMVSSLGTAELAGVSQSNSITLFFQMSVLGIVGGSSVLISQYWGKKDETRIRQIFAIVLWIAMLLAVVAVTLICLVPRGVLSLVTNNATVIQTALPYFTLVCFSYLPFAASSALIGMLRSVEVVRVELLTAVV